MNTTNCSFTYTTAEEQKSYFSGDYQNNDFNKSNEDILAPGSYRIIDGTFSRIITNVSPDTIKSHFNSVKYQDND